jgi:hypothetical protein
MGDAMREALSKHTRDVMLLAHQLVTDATPVDTSHAASNWLLSVGKPVYAVAGSRKAVDWGPHRAGRDKVAGYHVRMGQIYLRNNVAYIRRLNDGWSQQAPSKFVEISLAGAARRAAPGTKRQAGKMLRALGQAAIERRSSSGRRL